MWMVSGIILGLLNQYYSYILIIYFLWFYSNILILIPFIYGVIYSPPKIHVNYINNAQIVYYNNDYIWIKNNQIKYTRINNINKKVNITKKPFKVIK